MGDVTDFLEHAGVDFDVLEHTRTVRAADEAAALGIDAEEVAKTLILIAGSGNVRAVLPASERIDLEVAMLARRDQLSAEDAALGTGREERRTLS
jgi:prolyl-tRNA editing enzyme YbaK/EbsC (Cys-tRNA(Pro) deacylase)